MARRARRRRSVSRETGLRPGGPSWSDLAAQEALPRPQFVDWNLRKLQARLDRAESRRRRMQPRVQAGGKGVITPLSAKLRVGLPARNAPVSKSTLPSRFLPSGVRFLNPRRVWACVKRKARREVLFALDLAGHSGSGPGARRPDGKMYRRTEDSNYGC